MRLEAMDLRDWVVGGHSMVPVLGGGTKPYINLDNAASTPMALPVKEKVDAFLEIYAAVHRGSGFKSQLATYAYEQARARVAAFVGADLAEHTVIFVRNTTEAINHCANAVPCAEGDVLLTTLMEHHSNLLAWRKTCVQVESISVDDHGAPILDELEAKLVEFAGRVRLVAVSGGSNVTGVIPDMRRVARLTHAAGAELLVDAAQLAPHRPIVMGRLGEPESIDYLAMSAHKMYAPLGAGVLIGPRKTFEASTPFLVGGGAVLFVSEEEEIFNDLPDREEAGSPNTVGAVAMAAAATFLSETLGWDRVIAHERELTAYALRHLAEVPGVVIYGPHDPSLPEDRLGVLSFTMEGYDHRLVAAILSYEHAIATRTGCFCAHPYLMQLFGVEPGQVCELRDQLKAGDKRRMPGAVRISFGFYSRHEDVDAVVDGLLAIRAGQVRGRYQQEISTGDYFPESGGFELERYFSL